MSAGAMTDPSTSSPRGELRALVSLSLPIIAAQAGNQMMGVVDTAMVGRLGPAALAGAGIGNGLYFTVTLLGLGCVLGMDPLVSQAVGAGEEERARAVLAQGLRLAVLVGIPVALSL